MHNGTYHYFHFYIYFFQEFHQAQMILNYKWSLTVLCLRPVCIVKAFLVGQIVEQYGHMKPALSICLASTWFLTTEHLLELK